MHRVGSPEKTILSYKASCPIFVNSIINLFGMDVLFGVPLPPCPTIILLVILSCILRCPSPGPTITIAELGASA